jgi:methionine-rich copper-binding protein CopC
MRSKTRVSLAALCCAATVVALLTLCDQVMAHAILVEATPAVESTVSGPDISIKLRFNSRIDGVRSRLTLVKPDGSLQQLTISAQSALDTLTTDGKALSGGLYRLRWQVLASDGHITRGEIRFKVT